MSSRKPFIFPDIMRSQKKTRRTTKCLLSISTEITSKTNAAPNATITVLPSQKERILDALRKNASISISDAIRILGVQERQAQRILKSLIEEGNAVKIGAGRATRYAEAKKRTESHE